MLVFNTNAELCISPIYTNNTEEYEGGTRNYLNPIILACDGSHYDSQKTLNENGVTKAIEMVHSVK